MTNEVIFNPHNEILKGVNKLADAVEDTLGPSGKNVLIYKNNVQAPLITKDGVTVANHVVLSNQLENTGALLIKEASGKSNIVGDGTTTATVLARSIYKEGLAHLNSGYNPIDLKREIDDAVTHIVDSLKTRATPISSVEDIKKVALISSNNDEQLSDLLSKALHKVGKNGFVSVEDSQGADTTLSYSEGFQIERGVVSDFFFNQYNKVSFENASILILDHVCDNLKLLMPVLEHCHKKSEPIVIFAKDFEDNLLKALIMNAKQSGLKVACVHNPGSGDFQLHYMQDLQAVTKATILEPDCTPSLNNFDPRFLGKVGKIVIDLYQTNIYGFSDISGYVAELNDLINNCKEDFYKEKMKDRHARLTNSIAILSLGSFSTTELNDKKLRVEDTLKAVKAAMKAGILPGGGISLYRSKGQWATAGGKIIQKALEAPIRAILKNAGMNPEEVLMQINRHEDFNYGLDARKKVFGNLIDLGVVDPLLVVVGALQNAASAAGMMLTTNCVVMREVEDKK